MAAIDKWIKFRVLNELQTFAKVRHVLKNFGDNCGLDPIGDPTTTRYSVCKLTLETFEGDPAFYLWIPLLDSDWETDLLAGAYIPVTEDWSVEDTFNETDAVDINEYAGQIVASDNKMVEVVFGETFFEHFWKDAGIAFQTYDSLSNEFGEIIYNQESGSAIQFETEQFLICDEGGTDGLQIGTQFGGILGTQQKVGE